MTSSFELQQILDRLDRFLALYESSVEKSSEFSDQEDKEALAYFWQTNKAGSYLHPLELSEDVSFDDLQFVDRQKEVIKRNTWQFLHGYPANHILLTGSRGTGKSTLIRACLKHFAKNGLRMVEISREDLHDLREIVTAILKKPGKFILFCDDLSFEANDGGYKALKIALDGSFSLLNDRILMYAASNRRNLIPEFAKDNKTHRNLDSEELHFSDEVEEKISLSERFGLHLTFYSFDQKQYLAIVSFWLKKLANINLSEQVKSEALIWTLERGSRSGRVAYQFARDWIGRLASLDISR